MRFVLTHMEELLPIAIFLIVMIYSAIGKKKPPVPERDGDDSEYQRGAEGVAPNQAAQSGGTVDDELRRALGDIFAAKKAQTPKTHQRNDDEWNETVTARKIKDAKKAAAKAEAKAAQRAIDRAPSPLPGSPAYAAQALESTDAPPTEYASAEQARNGVIWSEILQSPLALR